MKIQHIIAGVTLCLPTLGWTQTAPTLQELIESATHIDYNLQQQHLSVQSKLIKCFIFIIKIEKPAKQGFKLASKSLLKENFI